MEIFHGDTAKIDRLNEILCAKAGFPACYDISTQTYTRKVDLRIASVLSAFGATAVRIGQVSMLAALGSLRHYATIAD
jgi:adenylosuccinate lyase